MTRIPEWPICDGPTAKAGVFPISDLSTYVLHSPLAEGVQMTRSWTAVVASRALKPGAHHQPEYRLQSCTRRPARTERKQPQRRRAGSRVARSVSVRAPWTGALGH